MAPKRKQKTKSTKRKQTKLSTTEKEIKQLIKQGRYEFQLKQYDKAIIAYKAALEIVGQKEGSLKKQYNWLWPTLTELYVQTDKIERAKTLYEDYLAYLLVAGSREKFRKACLLSRNIVGVNLGVSFLGFFKHIKRLM